MSEFYKQQNKVFGKNAQSQYKYIPGQQPLTDDKSRN